MRISSMKGIVLYAAFWGIAASGTAQRIHWDIQGLHEVQPNIRKLPPRDQNGIVRRLREEPEHLRAMVVNTQFGRIFLVQGQGDICGANNCAFWILTSDYKILLDKVTQTFKLQSSVHGGLPDIVTSMHDSAFESVLSYWRFQGKRYVRIACAEVAYSDHDGNAYKTPHISTRPCGTGG